MGHKNLPKRRQYINDLRKQKREKGICIFCDRPVETGFTSCARHIASMRNRRKAKPRNKCSNCSKPPLDGKSRCAACIEKTSDKHAKKVAKRLADGLCSLCAKNPHAQNRKLCESCLERGRNQIRNHRTTRLAAKLCVTCGKGPHLEHSVYCRRCFFRQVANNHFQTVSEWEFLAALFEAQKGRCAYSGIPLVLGLNATLDHIVPCAEGGSLGQGNVQWLDSMVDQMKWKYSEQAFLQMVKYIFHYRRLDD